MIRSAISIVCMLSLLAQPVSAVAQITSSQGMATPRPFPTMTPWNAMTPWGGLAKPRSSETPTVPDTASPNRSDAVDAQRWFSRVRLGERFEGVITAFGDPDEVVHQGGLDYLAYQVADGKGLFVVQIGGYLVDGMQMTNIMHNYAPLRDRLGVALGDTARFARTLVSSC